MAVLYRIIKFEGTQEAIDYQLQNSIAQGFVYQPNPEITITIKDRPDDPNECKFFESCSPSPVNGLITKKQLDQISKPV